MTFQIFIRSIAFRVGVSVALLFIVLFGSLYFFVERRGERAFTDVVTTWNGRFGIITPFDDPQMPWSNRIAEPRQEFRARFRNSLLFIGGLGVLGSVAIGALVASMITRPLRKVGEGMQKLRASDYNHKLAPAPAAEVDALVTEFNALTDELRRTDELRKTMISDVSHELATPITSLMAQLEAISDQVVPLDVVRIGKLRTQLDRLHSMVDGLQEYTRLRSRAVSLQRQMVDLRQVVDAVLNTHEQTIRTARMAVHVDIAAGATLQADPKLLEHVLNNLVANALRYSQGKTLAIRHTPNQLVVEDDGVGIPAEHRQNIFERFFRMEKSRSRETGGLGLGLAIVKEIVEAHGWRIRAEQSQYSTGAAFVITTHLG
ncbi:MAG: HAMP domain-containing sensor histidine kinase [Patescibacteria group bacterium]|jgi:signal transduction histidine kinase